jgi:hypothetical protein
MGQLQLVQFMKTPPLDDERMIEGLIELREKHGVKGPVQRIFGNLVDPSLSEAPFYAIMEDEDLVYWPRYIINPEVDLGKHHSVEQADE